MLLKRQNRATRCLARFKRTMSLCNIGQSEALVNRDSDFATGHHGEQIVRHFLRGLTRRHVREQRRPRHVQRAFARQQANI